MVGRTAAGQQIVASYRLSNHVGRRLAGQQVKTHRCSQRMCWRLSIRLGDGDPPPPHIGLPVAETKSSWREHALTRIEELDDYLDQLVADKDIQPRAARRARIHLEAAQVTAEKERGDWMGARLANSVHVERVMSHIDAAEAFILRAAPLEHVAAQVPAS